MKAEQLVEKAKHIREDFPELKRHYHQMTDQGDKNPKAMKNGGFPEDVLKDILEQLPIKSLFRFKSVSKRWNQLISDPYFARCYTCRCNHPHRTLLWTKYYSTSG